MNKPLIFIAGNTKGTLEPAIEELKKAAKIEYPDAPLMTAVFAKRDGYINGYKQGYKAAQQKGLDGVERAINLSFENKEKEAIEFGLWLHRNCDIAEPDGFWSYDNKKITTGVAFAVWLKDHKNATEKEK